ncbi:MAG TPA: HD-GYP domain-containing protein [Gaiellaceae bacterium]|nr:HD-GYP domain-containing protein [Gaiellaceae bacterium]
MLALLTRAIDSRDPYTRGHSLRVTALAEGVARRLGWAEERLVALRLGGALHDVGKLSLAPGVLEKPGPLTPEEVELVRGHPAVGAKLLAPIPEARGALPYVLHHHERWDGAGYPAGCAGTDIPEGARLLALADAFDAMTSDRPYRAALPREAALREIARCAGTQFDPVLADAFLTVWGAEAAPAATATPTPRASTAFA